MKTTFEASDKHANDKTVNFTVALQNVHVRSTCSFCLRKSYERIIIHQSWF